MSSSKRLQKAEKPRAREPLELTDQGSKKVERTSVACINCKKRRTKCTGLPSPCKACATSGRYCHFNPRLDTRRKGSIASAEIHGQVRHVLNGLLLALKFNPAQSVHELLALLREPGLQPQDIAKAIRKHLKSVQDKGLIRPMPIGEDDLISIVLGDVVSSQTGEKSATEDSAASDLSVEDFLRRTPINGESAHGIAAQQSPISYVPETVSDADLSSAEQSDDNIFEMEITQDGRYASTMTSNSHPNSSRTPETGYKTEVWPPIPEPEAFRFDDPAVVLTPAPRTWNDKHVFDIPLLEPQSAFSVVCINLRNSGRRALINGVHLDRMACGGQMDCELLFRDRVSTDSWNIPNWACEVARKFPPMTPCTRIAFALLLARSMPYLIAPSQDTWQQLPPLLWPTEMQMTIPHDITISFVPIPGLRDGLIQQPSDWLNGLLHHNFAMRWPGSLGDVEDATLSEAGHWYTSPCQTIAPASGMMAVDAGIAKAILRDPWTGRRYVSDDFERYCGSLDSWYASPSILETWPGISGQIQLI